MLGNPGFAQAINYSFQSGEQGWIVARRGGANSRNGHSRGDCQTRLDLGTRVSKPPETRQNGRKE